MATYFANVEQFEPFGELVPTGANAESARVAINRMMPRTQRLLISLGGRASITTFPAQSVGGHVITLDPIANIFTLHLHSVPHQTVLDILDQAIGALESDRVSSLIRTVNPFFYVGLLLDAFARAPARLLRGLGLHVEGGPLAVLLRAVGYLVALVGGLGKLCTGVN